MMSASRGCQDQDQDAHYLEKNWEISYSSKDHKKFLNPKMMLLTKIEDIDIPKIAIVIGSIIERTMEIISTNSLFRNTS